MSYERMNQSDKLLAIKLIHTIIWAFFVFVIFYILYSGITNRVNTFTWIGIGLIIGEGFVLLVFKMFCPLTLLARKYSDSQKENFDIFLPNWLAKHNKIIFTTVFIVGLILVVTRVFQNK
ncbi:hypothetical protein LX78_02361 [Xanthomarina spongicola]|uniref:DUF2784 family protein n=1 Tax=Xanthomarina spongicola TaxID=570520 RepID=A0A316DKC7_9FLAO|nr:hypothetical protein LX78_02361 [Xanthomarina spongicola]